MKSRNLYATLVGINSYSKNSLKGCIKDVLALDTFLRKFSLQQLPGVINYNPKYFLSCNTEDQALLSKHSILFRDFKSQKILSPSFDNISDNAFAHLKQANDGDICLFYYSGHGSTIKAPDVFKGGKSKLQNETIVCVDSRSGARDLIDKEIAYLLWDTLKGKNVHCVVIMDCCFAGNNTRGIGSDSRIGYRHTPDSNQQVPFDQYIGYGKNGFYTQQSDGTVSFPIGRYVHLAASMDNQTAEETPMDGGLFTSQLLDALQKGGTARSYRDLIQTTRVSVRNRNPNQLPVGFAANEKDLDQPFLGGDITPYRPTFEVCYDAQMGKWKLFGGAMDGLVSTLENPTRVKIVSLGIETAIEQVLTNVSFLDTISTDLSGFQHDTFQAVITKYATPPLEVCLSNGILEDLNSFDSLRTTYGDGSAFPFVKLFLEKENQDRPFQVRLTASGSFVLVRTGSTIPLFRRESDPKSFLTNVDYVGKWLVACELKHTQSTFSKHDFIFKLERIEDKNFSSNNIENLPADLINPDTFLPESIEFRYVNGNQPAFRLSIEINPKSNLQSCYVGALYLESKYRIRTNLIPSDTNQLVRGGSPIVLKYIHNGRIFSTLPLGIDPKYAQYNINEVISYLKIVVSEQPFSLDYYAQDELELDNVPNSHTRGDLGFDRQTDDTPENPDWFVFTSKIRTIGPKKSHVLENGTSVDFQAFDLEAPINFDATVYAGTGDDLAKLLARDKFHRSAQSTNSISPPPDLFGDAITFDHAFPAGISGAANNSIQLLELRPSQPGAHLALAPGEVIKIKPKSTLGDTETIVPFGYDEASGLYFPIGYTDDAGVINIEQLPMLSDGVIEDLSREFVRGDRSVGGSIKLFFQKIAWSRLTGMHEYDRLSLHRHANDGAISEITYSGSPRTQEKAAQIANEIGGGEALLLIHGIIGDTKGMVEAVFWKKKLHQQFAGVLTFDYENLHTGIDQTAEKLKNMLISCGFGEQKRLTIVAHSMGGLVSRYLIEHLEGDRFVKKLIQCGVPNSGSEMADFRRKVTGWLYAGLNGVTIFKPYMAVAAFLGKHLEKKLFHSLDQMDPDSSLLSKLNAPGKQNPGVPYYLVGGDTSQIGANHPAATSEAERIFTALKARGLYTGIDLVVFDREPNDMAVKIDRMKHLPWGAHDEVEILTCDHLNYFTDENSLEKIEAWVE